MFRNDWGSSSSANNKWKCDVCWSIKIGYDITDGIDADCYCSQLETRCCYCDNDKEEESNYCAEHIRSCVVCDTRISAKESYCWEHRGTYSCLVSTCLIRITEKDGYCSNHQKVCNKAGCDKRVSDNIFSSRFCSEHKEYNCSANNCHMAVSYSGDYCSFHGNICQESSCANRIANYQTYCSNCQQRQEKEAEQSRLKELVKANTFLTNPQEVERFSTYWNKNLATVVNSNSNYAVFLLVLDENNSVKVFPVNADCQWWGESKREQHNYLSDANNEASWLRGRLNSSSNPIMLIHPKCNYSYASFSDLITSPYVKVDYCASRSDFKPLDIAWVEKNMGGQDYYHVGVYLGNGEICNIAGWYFNRKGVRKTTWSGFLYKQNGNIRRYSPIIPFKNYKEIIAQLVWAQDNEFREGRYCLASRNCELLPIWQY